MEARADTTAVWSFLLPVTALLATWLAYGGSSQTGSAGILAVVAVADTAVAAAGLTLVARSERRRAWAVAGAIASVLLLLAAAVSGLGAALTVVLSGLTF